jgi:hypothetical protein
MVFWIRFKKRVDGCNLCSNLTECIGHGIYITEASLRGCSLENFVGLGFFERVAHP